MSQTGLKAHTSKMLLHSRRLPFKVSERQKLIPRHSVVWICLEFGVVGIWNSGRSLLQSLLLH